MQPASTWDELLVQLENVRITMFEALKDDDGDAVLTAMIVAHIRMTELLADQRMDEAKILQDAITLIADMEVDYD
jgi:hypothetical protein